MATTTVNFLIPAVRLRIGDMDATAYRYADSWILTALVLSVKTLQKYWNYKYLVNDVNEVYRNEHTSFLFPEPPVIQNSDEGVIVLMAAIIMLEGSLENSAWSAVSWRDAEISFSNLEQFRSRDTLLGRLLKELSEIIKAPTLKLIWPSKQSLPGYKKNKWETTDKY
jgi:hypothetical protein